MTVQPRLIADGSRPIQRVFWKGRLHVIKHLTFPERVMAGLSRVEWDGYVKQLLPWHPHANSAGWIHEHRVVAERKLGRYLRPGECVHHIDGDRANNAPENLTVFPSNSAHMRCHARQRSAA